MGGLAPYGAWPSPITPGSLAAGSVRITTLAADGDDLWWSETRPGAQGRTALMRRSPDGSVREMTPPDANVRSRVHSYGGGAWWVENGVCVYSDDSDFRLRCVAPDGSGGESSEGKQGGDGGAGTGGSVDGGEGGGSGRGGGGEGGRPLVLTPDGPDCAALYADGRFSADGQWFVCVRERVADPEHVNEIVSVALDGSGQVEVTVRGADFYSDPRPSSCGRWLAWLQWNHPNMPWDGCELHIGCLDGPRLTASRRIAGGPEEWIFGPAWRHDGALSWVSDGSGASTLWLLEGDPLAEEAEPRRWVDLSDGEIQTPPWVFGMSRYATWAAPGGGSALGYAVSRHGATELRIAGAPADPERDAGHRGHTSFNVLRAWRSGVVAVAGAATAENEIVHVMAPRRAGATGPAAGQSEENETVHGTTAAADDTPQASVVYAPPSLRLDPGFTPEPEPITFPTSEDAVAHALLYRPANPACAAPAGSGPPPLLVMAHGGPTGAARTALHLGLRYWTSRGVAVVDVDYRGSTGYGRAYRRALDGGWGVTDVADCVAAARWLAGRGEADEDRLAIIGASAGGYAVLQALIDYDVFAAGLIRYGVADLEALARDTHKFEKHYMDRLVGPYPAERARYVERSPIHRVDRIACPMLVLQGDSDPVVPPDQAEALVAALEANGLPHAYLLFEGEQHGFRGGEAITAAAAAELSFLGQIFGFEPAGDIDPVAVRNL
ncbi:MAG: prolyl oligopeptidase family serine peptidase [bacterium]|nr:prolyl oligopeptidase family serine peptidase [bacterium]MDE0667795.1 prolyl oligopeptidase family serine peptidase [bacterium]